MSQIKKIEIKILEKINNLYVWKLPPILVFASLILLIFRSIDNISSLKKILPEFLGIYLATIVLTVALASVSFSYARILPENNTREKIVYAGESFLHAAVSAIVAILLVWLSDEISTVFQGWNYFDWTRYIGIAIGVLGQMFLYIVAVNLYRGLIDLQQILLLKTKKNL